MAASPLLAGRGSPITVAHGVVTFASAEPFDVRWVADLAQMLRHEVKCVVANPLDIHRYDAEHGFANEQRLSVHDRQCAEQAWGRATEYFAKHLG